MHIHSSFKHPFYTAAHAPGVSPAFASTPYQTAVERVRKAFEGEAMVLNYANGDNDAGSL